jgi:hypothetical protein
MAQFSGETGNGKWEMGKGKGERPEAAAAPERVILEIHW